MEENNKVVFIVCANDNRYYDECAWYINRLHIPSGCQASTICITGAENMTEGYNAAMKSSDAKFKIYLHQDVFIRNRFFLDEIMNIFRLDKAVGMIGVVGGRNLPKDAVIYDKWNLGFAYCSNRAFTRSVLYHQDQKMQWMEADAIDGMLMVTQYDLDWRQDLMLGWDFYDISQSMEFLRNGYKIAIPFQKEPWCIHDCGHSKLGGYDRARRKILEEYTEFFPETFTPFCDEEFQNIQRQIAKRLRGFIEQNSWEDALEIRKALQDTMVRDNDLQFVLNLLDIYLAEMRAGIETGRFFEEGILWKEIRNKYDDIKFLIRRFELASDEGAMEKLAERMKEEVSEAAVWTIGRHSAIDIDLVMKTLIQRCRDGENDRQN